MAKYELNINNTIYKVNTVEDMPLVWVLRDILKLKGTKYGCGVAECGACTVHFNGNPARSCVIPVSSIKEAKITTIEGLSDQGDHPIQLAWVEQDVPQCGYCQAGQIMSAASLLKHSADPSDKEIDNAMQGNLCRCGTYQRIRSAIKVAAKKVKNER